MSKKKNQHKLDIKVKCDKCGKEFYPKIKELAILKGCIIVSGFTCKCGAEYVTTVTDNELRRDLCRLQDLQDEYKREQKKMGNHHTYCKTDNSTSTFFIGFCLDGFSIFCNALFSHRKYPVWLLIVYVEKITVVFSH